MKWSHVLVLALIVAATSVAVAKDSKFLVIAPHTPEECLKALDDVNAKGAKFLGKFDWGCAAGDHTGYVMLEGKDEAAVKAMLPSSMMKATVVKLNKFTPEEIKSFHASK